jgi:hypothetical protein
MTTFNYDYSTVSTAYSTLSTTYSTLSSAYTTNYYSNINIDSDLCEYNVTYKKNDIEYNVEDLVKFAKKYNILWDIYKNNVSLNKEEKPLMIEGVELKI